MDGYTVMYTSMNFLACLVAISLFDFHCSLTRSTYLSRPTYPYPSSPGPSIAFGRKPAASRTCEFRISHVWIPARFIEYNIMAGEGAAQRSGAADCMYELELVTYRTLCCMHIRSHNCILSFQFHFLVVLALFNVWASFDTARVFFSSLFFKFISIHFFIDMFVHSLSLCPSNH
ncbi:hypothetical protein SCHPADRAFT_119271 [Schizopora paradoxa]|uniref:Uncharacterized protein n=1 Tax=Schizopora paradoxa TaxID=27342 RepID=A0A0H2SN25_9AGAM|nr:hypothetical protein SCHPADRAFT_119271 [Schizopora paradoxa]